MPRHRSKRRPRAGRPLQQSPTSSMPAMSLTQPAQYPFLYQYPFQPGFGSWYNTHSSPFLASLAPWGAAPAPWGPAPAPWGPAPAPWAPVPSTPDQSPPPSASLAADPPAIASAASTKAVIIVAPVTASQEAPSGRVPRETTSLGSDTAVPAARAAQTVEEFILPSPPPAVPLSPPRLRLQRTPSPSFNDDIILISDDEDECSAEEVVLPDGTLHEDFCTICILVYEENTSFVGILHGCSCYKFSSYCYPCAVQLREMQKCPRCRKECVETHTDRQVPSSSEEHEEVLASKTIEMDEDGRRQQILDELEVVPDSMKATKEDVNKLSNEAESILNVIDSLDCRQHLQSIACGERRSERHAEFQESGMLLSGLGPFTLFEDMQSKLMKIIDNHCKACVNMDDPTYQWSVMIPEAIIYGAQIILKCTKVNATTYYENTSKLITIQE